MSSEKKEILTAVIVGITEVVFNVLSIIVQKDFLIIGSVCLSITFGVLVIVLYFKYRCLSDSYKLIQFLFFGNEYNTFNFLPKLKLYMDYIGNRNNVEVGLVEFECTNDNNKDITVEWTMKNVQNTTKKEIYSYYLYTSSDVGKTNKVMIELDTGNSESLKINADDIKENNGIRKTPFTFIEPIEPNSSLSEIKIKMKMQETFDLSGKNIVHLYPRNYGKKVRQINIEYKTKNVKPMDVQLHEIGRRNNVYVDMTIKNSQPIYGEKPGNILYKFCLGEQQINMNSIYYLMIKEAEEED